MFYVLLTFKFTDHLYGIKRRFTPQLNLIFGGCFINIIILVILILQYGFTKIVKVTEQFMSI